MSMRSCADGGSDIFVNDQTAQVLNQVGDRFLNLVSVFGGARQGKSFLMNLLANEQDLFQISNRRDPCTHGIDLARRFIPLSDFAALNEGNASGSQENPGPTLVGFVDAEGQGDRDITCTVCLYDSPILCSD
jgi:hypothetical protein